MVDKVDTKGMDPREQLRQELLFHAGNSAIRAVEFSARVTANMLVGDDEAARNCQFLASLNANGALMEAYEAGEVVSTNKERGDEKDPVFIGFTGLAVGSIGMAMAKSSEAETLQSQGKENEAVQRDVVSYSTQALDQAYEAGKYIGNGKRSGIRPTFTILPEEQTS